MRCKNICLAILMFSVVFSSIVCSSRSERLLIGSWKLEGFGIDVPSDIFFEEDGSFIAPKKPDFIIMRSSGTYKFLGSKQLELEFTEGYKKGKRYTFEIVKLTKSELILKMGNMDTRYCKFEGY